MITRYHYLGVGVALALAFAGGRMSAEQPAVKETSKAEAQSSAKFDMREDWATSWNFTEHTPPKEIVRWYRKYVPGAKPGECKIAEEGGEHEKTGPGVITGGGVAAGAVAAKGEAKAATKVETSRIVTPAPVWSVSLQAGASIPEPLLTLPGASHAVVGLVVERQIIGPFKLGLWANSAGSGGVSVGGEF